jgi:hypothetical protein
MLVNLPALPALFMGISWTLRIPQQKNRSEFTSRTQTIGTPGAEEWLATARATAPATLDEMFAWHAFLASCRGSENTFNLPALAIRQRTGGSPTVAAAVAGNRAVTVNDPEGVVPGMYATVRQTDGHDRLVKVVAVNGLNIHFEPYLTANPSIGAALIVNEPYARMQLVRADQVMPEIGEFFQFEAEEKL